MKNLGDKIREAVPGLSEVPSAGQAVQAGKDLVGKLPSAGDVQGAHSRYNQLSAECFGRCWQAFNAAQHCVQETGRQAVHCYWFFCLPFITRMCPGIALRTSSCHALNAVMTDKRC